MPDIPLDLLKKTIELLSFYRNQILESRQNHLFLIEVQSVLRKLNKIEMREIEMREEEKEEPSKRNLNGGVK